MPIVSVTGDLFDNSHGVRAFAHGCNCQGSMGAGVAKTFRVRYPEMYEEFSKEIAKMDSNYKRLKTELTTSPNQEAILQAMIRNLQTQTEVLNQQLNIIEHYSQMKKDEKNETKGI